MPYSETELLFIATKRPDFNKLPKPSWNEPLFSRTEFVVNDSKGESLALPLELKV